MFVDRSTIGATVTRLVHLDFVALSAHSFKTPSTNPTHIGQHEFMSTVIEASIGAQGMSSLDHHYTGGSQSSQCSQQFASTFGGGKPIFGAVHEEMSQRRDRSDSPSGKDADMGEEADDLSRKRKFDDEAPEDFMTQRSQEDAVYSSSQSPGDQGLMNVDEHKNCFLQQLQGTVNSSWDVEGLDAPMDPFFKFFAGQLKDRKEQERLCVALSFIVVNNKITSVSHLLRWASNCKSTFAAAADMQVEHEVRKIQSSVSEIFRPATPASAATPASTRADVVSETPPSQTPASPKQPPARNLRKEMSPAVPGGKRAGSYAERSPGQGGSACDESLVTEREMARHVEKAEEIQTSVSVMKIKRRRLLQQVEHVRSMEQTRKEADKARQAAAAQHKESSAALEEAKRALAEAEARVLQLARQEREDKEEAEVAALRAEQAATEARSARNLMEDDKKEFEQVLGRLRRTVQPGESQPR